MKEFINLNKKFKELDSCINASNEPEQCSIADIVRGQPQKKKVKTTNIKPIAFVRFNTKLGKPKPITIKVLLDSGASESVIKEKHCKNLRVKKDSKKTTWTTPGGTLTTSKVVKAEFTLPELQDDKLIEWNWHVVKDLGSYDAIIGRDLMQFLGIDILFSDQTVKWGNATMPFKDGDCSTQEAYYVQEPEQLVQASERLKSILDAKYERADVQDIANEQTQLNDDEKEKQAFQVTVQIRRPLRWDPRQMDRNRSQVRTSGRSNSLPRKIFPCAQMSHGNPESRGRTPLRTRSSKESQPLSVGSTNFSYSKERWISTIHLGLPRTQQKD